MEQSPDPKMSKRNFPISSRMGKYKDGWLPARGLVYSVEWIDPSRNDFGHYNVVYSYSVNNERYTGDFRDYRSPTDDYLHRNDVFDIQYNPERPERSYYPLVQSAANRRLTFISIGVVIAAVVMLVLYFDGSFK